MGIHVRRDRKYLMRVVLGDLRLIDWIEFYAVSAIFQPRYGGGDYDEAIYRRNKNNFPCYWKCGIKEIPSDKMIVWLFSAVLRIGNNGGPSLLKKLPSLGTLHRQLRRIKTCINQFIFWSEPFPPARYISIIWRLHHCQ